MEIAQHFGDTYSLESKLIFFFELLGSHSENIDMVTYIIFFQKEVSASTLQEIKNLFLTLGYDAGSQLGVIPFPRDPWQYLETLPVVTKGEGAIGIEDLEARDAAKHPTVQRWLHRKESFGPEVQ